MSHIRFGYSEAFKQRRLILVLFLVNFLLGLLAALPLFFMAFGLAGYSQIGSLPGGLENWYFFSDLITHEKVSLQVAIVAGCMVLGLSLFASVFLAGGTLSVLQSKHGYSSSTFWGGAGVWFMPFLRVLFCLLPHALVFGLGLGVVLSLVEVIAGEDPTEAVGYWLGIACVVAAVVALMYGNAIMGIARARLLQTGSRKAWPAVKEATKLAMRRFFALTPLCLAFVGPGLLLLWGKGVLHMTLGSVVVVWLVGQVYVLLRTCLKVGLTAALVSFQGGFAAPEKPLSTGRSEGPFSEAAPLASVGEPTERSESVDDTRCEADSADVPSDGNVSSGNSSSP